MAAVLAGCRRVLSALGGPFFLLKTNAPPTCRDSISSIYCRGSC